MKKQKILIVDDDTDIGMMLQLMLNFKGYDVTVFDNPENIETEIANDNYDLIFMDMLLSGRNGIDICVGLKSNPRLAHIPLIMMSAHPDAKNICKGAGANDFIAKPFDMKEMLQKVVQLLPEMKVS